MNKYLLFDYINNCKYACVFKTYEEFKKDLYRRVEDYNILYHDTGIESYKIEQVKKYNNGKIYVIR